MSIIPTRCLHMEIFHDGLERGEVHFFHTIYGVFKKILLKLFEFCTSDEERDGSVVDVLRCQTEMNPL